jgi:inner membrane protein YidH
VDEQDPAEIITERGSRARDHLANERTYLAWLRTAATVMVLGLAIAKLVEPSNGRTIAAGAILVATGAAGLVEAGLRYRRVNRELEEGRFVTGSLSGEPLIAGVVLVVAIAVAFLLIIV